MDYPTITLTSHQQAAVDWLVTQLVAGEKLIALRGLAGTGKTSIMPALQDALRVQGIPSTIGAPTHRAAMILRKKHLDADTLHARALVPYFSADYRQACAWLGEELPTRPDETPTEVHAEVEGLPWLVYEAVQPDLGRGRDLKRQRRHKAQRRLLSLGISGKDHFTGFGPKAGQGVLIIDEASMVGTQMLALCQEAYPQIVLVGDPGQLPPVKDTAMLATVPGVDLTEIHRQAADSPIVQLAYRAREGAAFWTSLDRDPLSVGQPVRAMDAVSARRFLTCPLLVWRNETRTFCTQAIRQALGYTRERLVVGEPLVCRATAQEDRAMGFYNNGLYTITEVSAGDPRSITVKDAMGETQPIRAHLEELDGDFVDPRAIPFRFGYVLTVHTAQGGEWPRVYVSLPEVQALAGQRHRDGRQEEFAQWTYTAITRAKTTLRFLTQHTFTTPQERTTMPADKIQPPSAPLLTLTPEPVEPEPVQAETPEEVAIFGADDISNPAVPLSLQETLKEGTHEGRTDTQAVNATLGTSQNDNASMADLSRFNEHEALLQGFLTHFTRRFDEAVKDSVREITKTVDGIYEFVHHQMQIQREKAQQAETLLDTLTTKAVTQGIQVRHDPYTVTVQTLSPQGFPVTLTVAKQDSEALVEELGALTQWLAQQGYKPVVYP
jgi:hypothetical protein